MSPRVILPCWRCGTKKGVKKGARACKRHPRGRPAGRPTRVDRLFEMAKTRQQRLRRTLQ